MTDITQTSFDNDTHSQLSKPTNLKDSNAPVELPTCFTVDDAFSDGGDDIGFEFTSQAVREERDRVGMADAHDEEGSVQESLPPSQSSISTFNLDQDAYSEKHPGSPTTSSCRADGSLGRSSTPEGNQPETADAESELSFPAVVIDLSKSPSHQVTVLPESSAEASIAAAPSSSENGHLPSASQKSEPPPLHVSSTLSPSSAAQHARRPSRATGPSALEKVISKTRPSYLPPKPKDEDVKHLADWENMMKQSRVAEEQRVKQRRERRIARDRAIEESTHIWESSILPDWKSAIRNPTLRKLWWNGVPPKLRGAVWEKAFGNALALSKDTYRACLARAKHALSAGSFPTTTLNLMDSDIRSTLPSLNLFHPSTGPLYQDLHDLLCAWVVSRSDEGLGYVTGASKIAAMFLLYLPSPTAFVAMRNLLERHCMRSFYGGMSCKEDVEAYYRIFDTLLADCMPKIYFNFKQHQVSPAAYLPDWLMSLFLEHLPLDACARVWDVIALEGDSFLFRAALAVLSGLESRLFFPDRQELLDLLGGHNKAALEVAKRDGRVLGGHKYDIYGLDEEVLWAQIDMLQEWWKESTWSRLIQRELPDL